MAATEITEPTGKAAGRVTITGAFVSLIPPFATVLLVVIVFLVGIINAETAGAVVLGILATAGLTTGTVFTVQKNTPTDQYAVKTEVVAVPVPDTEAKQAVAQELEAAEPVPVEPEPTGSTAAPTAVSLEDEVAALRSTGA